MADKILREKLIKLAYDNPDMRDTLIPIINEFSDSDEQQNESGSDKTASETSGEEIELESDDEEILNRVWANIAKEKAKYKKHDEWMARRVHLDSKDK